MGRAEVWARAHKGLLALLAAAAAALGVLLFLLHPKGQAAAQNAISYIPAPFTQQPDAGAAAASTASTAIPTTPTPSPFWFDRQTLTFIPVPAHPIFPNFGPPGSGPGGGTLIEGGLLPPGYVPPPLNVPGPAIPIKTTLGNVPSSSAVMGGVG